MQKKVMVEKAWEQWASTDEKRQRGGKKSEIGSKGKEEQFCKDFCPDKEWYEESDYADNAVS